MEKSVKRFLKVSGVTAAGAAIAGAAHRSVTKYFVRVALDRDMPKHIPGSEQILTRTEKEAAYWEVILEAGERLRQKPCETVEITGKDGTVLVGHWLPCRNPRRVIIAMHGWRSTWINDFGAVADFWEDSGCSVLFAEQRGQGSSGGEYMGFGLIERYDCLDWIRWVMAKVGADVPVYLAGISMGASTVLMAAGLELPACVHGIMADCGYTSPAEIWKHIAKNNLHLSYSTHRAAANDLCKKKIQMGIDEYSCMDAMKQCRVPVLFVHGTEDHFVPVEMTYENFKACAAPKRLFVVPGAEHGMSYFVDKEGYEKVVRAFWEEYD